MRWYRYNEGSVIHLDHVTRVAVEPNGDAYQVAFHYVDGSAEQIASGTKTECEQWLDRFWYLDLDD